MSQLFDMRARAMRRDRAARTGVELFLYERAFEDCLDRLGLMDRRFESALLIGCPDQSWRERLGAFARSVELRDPGRLFAASDEAVIVEDSWRPADAVYDLVLAIGTLDTANDLRLALRVLRYTMTDDALLMGAVSGGDTLPQLRNAMRAADAVAGAAAPHVHPRIEASALAPLLAEAGFVHPVVDVDRVPVGYRSLGRLVDDLRAMGATNVLSARPRFVGKEAYAAAVRAFCECADGDRTVETFEILHFASWTPKEH